MGIVYSRIDVWICCRAFSCTGMVSDGFASSKKKQEAFIRFLGLPSKVCDDIGFWFWIVVMGSSWVSECVSLVLMGAVGTVVLIWVVLFFVRNGAMMFSDVLFVGVFVVDLPTGMWV